MEENQAVKKIAKGAGYVFVGMFLSKVMTYMYRVIVARLGSDVYGTLSIALAVIGIVTFIPLLGLDTGVIRFVSYYRGKNNEEKIKGAIISALRISVPFSIIIAGIVFISANIIASQLFQDNQLGAIIKILSISIPFTVFSSILFATIKGFYKIEYWVGLKNIGENLIRIILTAIMIILGLNLIGATIAYATAIILTTVMAVYVVEKKIFSLVSKKIRLHLITAELLKYSVPLMFHMLIAQVIVYTDLLMLGYFRTTSEVGIYNAALPTATLLSIVPGGIIALFLPIMTELYAKEKKKDFSHTLKSSTKWIFFINLPIFLTMVLFSRELLSLFFSEEYGQGSAALIILAVGVLIYQLFSTSTEVLNVIQKTKLVLTNTLIASSINIILNYLLIPRYGMIGGAIATSISLILLTGTAFIEVILFTGTVSLNLNFLKAVFGSIISFSIMLLLKPFFSSFHLLIQILVGGAIIMSIYLITLILLKSFEKSDISILKSIESKLNSKIIQKIIILLER